MSVTAPDDAFLDVNDAHLRVFGNVHADGLKLGQLEVVTTTSTGSTIQFLHQHTAFTTTSNIEVGSSNLFVDTNTSRVGILTNTPTTALDVNGTVKATAFDGDGALLTGIPSSAINGTLSQWTTVTGPKIHYSDGNVGIGIADPLHTLDVVGDINFTGTLREDGNPFVSTPWTIETSPTALSYTSGNVGIGAATPSAKLEVTGNAHVTTDLSVGGTLSINTITAAATHALSAVTAVGASTGDTLQLTNATTGLVTTGNVEVGRDLSVTGNLTVLGTRTIVDTDTLRVKDPIIELGKDNPGTGDLGLVMTRPSGSSNVGIIFDESESTLEIGYTQGSASDTDITMRTAATEPLDVNVNGNVSVGKELTVSGNVAVDTDTLFVDSVNDRVGVGTTSPATALEVFSTTGTQLKLSSDSRYSTIFAVDDTGSCFFGNDRGAMRFTTGGDTSASGASEKMRILADGNVGIGTTSPSSQLELYGAGKDLTFKYDTGISRRSAATRDAYYSGLENSIKRVGDRNIFDGSSFTPDTTHEILMGFSDIYHQWSGNDEYYPQHNEMRFKLWSPTSSTVGSLTDVLTLRGNGNVGIGTVDPKSVLHVSGDTPKLAIADNTEDDCDVNGFSTGIMFVDNTWNGSMLYSQNPAAGMGFYLGHFSSSSKEVNMKNLTGELSFGTRNEHQAMYIDNDGNVGIGTTSPNWPLEVSAGNDSITYYGPNSSWSSYLAVGAASDKTITNNTAIAQCISTNGNLHLDAAATRDIYMNHYSGAYIRHNGSGLYSDDRLKSEEEPITNATDTLLKLSPQKYTKARSLREGETRDPFTETGLIAQDIWYDTPELRHLVQLGADANPVDTKPEAPVDGDIQQDPDYSSWGPNEASVNYDGLIAYLIKSNQELHARIQALENVS